MALVYDHLLIAGGLLAALLVAVALLVHSRYKRDSVQTKMNAVVEENKALEEQNKTAQEQSATTAKQVEEVNEIHDRLESDPAYRQRVRDRFTRPD